MSGLGPRSETILHAIVSEYISSGEPVGSRTVSKKFSVGLSAATIRNIMGDLTDMGFIEQPHVSAGRVPTDLGYRVYVDRLIATQKLNSDHEASIESSIKTAGLDVRDVLRHSSVVLAELSRQAGVSICSPVDEQTFKTIEFIKISFDRILVVLVSTTGLVQNKVIYDEDNVNQETLEIYGRQLNEMLKDLDLRQARERIERELCLEKTRFDVMLAKTLRLGHIILSDNSSAEVFVEGQTNIVDDPEFSQIENLKAVLVTFEHKSALLKILDKTLNAQGVQILIGSEHGLDQMRSCSIIAYPLRADRQVLGCIGVVGSKRMNYSKVVPIVDATASAITKVFKRLLESNS
ncbi:MAG: heat-inducible transcriptional repressor HrcA [Desulfomonilaceae bacterium]